MQYSTRAIISITVVLLSVIFLGFALVSKMIPLPSHYFRSQPVPDKTLEQPPSHIVMIIVPNKTLASILDNSSAPFINKLVHDNAVAKNYHAIANHSLPNYIGMTSGTTAGITNDCSPPSSACQADVMPITKAIERSGRTWKMYAEGMSEPCTPDTSGSYAVTRNPFMYYPVITSNSQYCSQHVVPFGELDKDLRSTNSLPNYVFISPALCNDTHDCSIEAVDAWLSKKVPNILGSPAFNEQRSLLAITWDKGDTVPLIFAGHIAKRGYTSSNYYTHYSLLRTIESLWHLPSLAEGDESAGIMYDMLQ